MATQTSVSEQEGAAGTGQVLAEVHPAEDQTTAHRAIAAPGAFGGEGQVNLQEVQTAQNRKAMVNARQRQAIIRQIESLMLETASLSALLAQQAKGELGFASEELQRAGKALERALSWMERS